MTKPAEIRDVLRTATELDYEMSVHPGGRDNPDCTPWMPFPMFDFIALTAEALQETRGDRFLEVGCGPGTRMLLAREIYGFDVTGIERTAAYAERGHQLGLKIEVADAMAWKGYGNFDLVWFNRPFRDRSLQRQLEAKIWDALSPGAVVMCANLENPPPSSWILVLDDWEIRRGIWQKP